MKKNNPQNIFFLKRKRQKEGGYVAIYKVVLVFLVVVLSVVFFIGFKWFSERMDLLEKEQEQRQLALDEQEQGINNGQLVGDEEEESLGQGEETETLSWEEYAQEETGREAAEETAEEMEAEAVSETTDNNAAENNSSEEPQTASSTALNVTEESGSGSSQSDSNNSSNSGQNSSQGFSESPDIFYLEEGIITSYYIKDKSITKEDVARRSITHTLLHSNAVTTRIIKDHTITKDDLAKDLEIKTSGDVEVDDLTVDEVTAAGINTEELTAAGINADDINTTGITVTDLTAEDITATDLTATNLAATSAVFTAVATDSISIGGTDIGNIYLAKAGGTMTGSLVLAADPTSALEAATKQYVDNQLATADTFLELTDTISTYNTGRILFETGSAVTDSSNLTFSSDILSTPNLGVSGDAAISGDVTLAGLSGAGATNNVLVVDGSGNVDYQAIDSRVWGTSLADGSGTANYLAVWSDGDTLTTGVLYDDGTNIGIGTTSVNAKLEVNSGTSGVSGLRFTQFTNSSASIANPTSKVLSVDSDGDIILVDDDTGSGSMPSGTLNGQTLRYNGSGWVTSNTLFNDGTDVGIGTTSPTNLLNVFTSATQTTPLFNVEASGAINSSIIARFRRTGSTYNTVVDIDSNGGNAFLSLSNNTVGKWWIRNESGLSDIFSIGHTSSANDFVIDRDGNVGIGTTSPGAKLDVRGGINAGTNGTEFTVSTAGAVVAASSITGDSLTDGTLTISSGDITSAGAITATGTITGGTLTDGTFTVTGGVITGATGITSSGTITFSGLSGDTDDTILILNSSNQVATREIDSHVWGGSLIDGSGTADYVAYWSDADTLTAEQYLSVTRGGTGVGTLTEGGILYGNGTSAVQAMAVLTNGQLLIGDGTGAPTAATLTGTSNQITVANGAGSITLSTPQDIATTSTPQFARLGLGTAAHASDILTILSTSTTDTSKGLNISHTGAITGTGYGGYFSKTGASTTNVGLYASASGATNNYAAIFENGNVGIGTGSPDTLLHMVNDGTIYSTIETTDSIRLAGLNLKITAASTGAASLSFTQGDGSGSADNMRYTVDYRGNEGYFRVRSNDIDGTSTDGDIFRVYDGTDDLVIPSGDVGIGTTIPGAKLDVRGGVTAGTNGTEFAVSTAGAVTGVSFTDGTLTITSGDITGAGAITASGIITGGTLTDGTFSVTAGTITGATWNGNSIADAYIDDNITLTNITQITNRSILDTTGTLTVARGGTGAVTFTQYGVIYGNAASALQVTAAGADNQVLVGNTGGAPSWANASTLAGQIDHGSITGLSDDDHTQYALLAGRSGGQTLIGGTGTTDGLTFQTTSATGTTGADMHFLVGDNGATEALTILNSGYVGIGTAGPDERLHISGNIKAVSSNDQYGVTIEPKWASSQENGITFTVKGYDTANGTYNFKNESGYLMTILDTGNVGIGTVSPGSNLNIWESSGSRPGGVTAATNSVLKLSRTGTTSYAYNESAEFRIGHGGPSIYGSKLDLYINGASNTSNVPDTHVMTWNYNGNVGIGTTAPGSQLEIYSNETYTSSSELWPLFIKQPNMNDTTTGGRTGILISTAKGSGRGVGLAAVQEDIYGNDVGMALYTGGSGTGEFKEQVRIDHAGNVGIGTTNPVVSLHITGTDFNSTYHGMLRIDDTAAQAEGVGGGILFGYKYTDAGAYTYGPQIRAYKSDSTSGSPYAGLQFRTRASSGVVNAMMIKDSGDVGIGTASPGYKLEIGGGDVNTTAGGYRDAGTCVAGTCASDIRLKDNIQELSSSLDKILQLKPSTFEFNDPKYGSTDTNYGLIAQEVEEIFPEWVIESDDGYKKIRYGQNIQMNFLKAFQEHYALTEPLIDSFDISGNQIVAQDFLNATADGLSTKVINDPINGVTDDDFQVSPANLNGAMAIDSANGRFYFRYADNWHYVNQTGGFQIPNYETAPAAQLNSKAKKSKKEALDYESSSYDDYLTEKLMPGDFLIPYVDEYLPDGAVHGLYARFSDVKGKMFKEEQEKLDSLVTLADSNLQSISDLENAIDENFSLVGGRLDELEERLEDLEWQATNNEEAIEGLTTRQGELETEQSDLATQQSELAARQSALEALLNGGAESNLGSSGLTESSLEFLPQFISADDEGVLTLGADTLIKGKLTVAAIETQEMTSQQITSQSIAARDLSLSEDTSGVARISAGETEIKIKTAKAEKNNLIYLSPMGDTFGKVIYVDEVEEGEGFMVKITEPEEPLEEDINFNWLIILGH